MAEMLVSAQYAEFQVSNTVICYCSLEKKSNKRKEKQKP